MTGQEECTAVAVAIPQPRRGQTILWIIAILLAVIATALIMRSDGVLNIQSAYGGDSPMAGARGIFAFTGQIDKNSYGLFMMDVDSSNVWCYQYVPRDKELRLVAARSFLYDRYLENVNNGEPTPQQARVMLAEQRRIKARLNRGGIAPDNQEEDEKLGTVLPDMPTDLDKDK